jgi:hypothetical protein
MSMGWMMHVAIMPLAPPLRYGFTAFQTLLSDMVASSTLHRQAHAAIHGTI